MNKKKILNLFLAITTMILVFFSSNINVYADELSFAVAPSKVVNLVIEPGSKEVITFKVGNRSIFPSHQVEKNELYNFEILVEGKMYDSDGTEIKDEGIVKVSQPTLRCKPNEAVSVDVTIDIPSNFEKNSYEIAVVFTRMPIAGVEDTTNTSAITSIKVPVYLGVGNPDEYSKLKTNYEVEKFKIDLGEEKTILKYVGDNLKKLITLNPSKITKVFKSIPEKDVYVVKKGDSIVIDTVSDIFTNLNSVITDDEKKLNNNKYVLASKEDYTKAVKNVYFEEKLVKFQLEGDTAINLKCENRVRDNIRTQINTLMKEYELKSPKFQFFVENLKVPKNNNYNIPQYNVDMTLKNTGEKETFVTASMVLKKDSTTEVGSAKLELATLKKGNLVDISIPLELNGDFSNGTYNLYGSFIDVKNVARNANFKFDVNLNLDKQIYIITLVIYIISILILIILILILIEILRNRKGIFGYIIKESVDYVNIPETEENLNLYKEVLDIENVEDLSRYRIITSMDVIVRNKPNSKDSKTIKTLHRNAIVEIIDDNVESDDVIWVKIKFNKKMIDR